MLHSEMLDPSDARSTLYALVEQALETPPDGGRPCALRVETPVRGCDPLTWLAAQRESVRVFWADRAGRFAIAGVGAADRVRVSTADALPAQLASIRNTIAGAHPDLRYYGGLRFDPGREPDALWQPYGAGTFHLPQFELLHRGGQTTLACNLVLRNGSKTALDEIGEGLDRLEFPDMPGALHGAAPATRTDHPNQQDWAVALRHILEDIAAGRVEKVVMARRSDLVFSNAPDPFNVLRALAAQTARAYHFCIEPEPGTAFLGASPERLFLRKARFIESEAVAGTAPRGATEEEDRRLASSLLEDDKELREHAFVVEAVRAALDPLCATLHADTGTSVLKLPACQHLFRRIEGILNAREADAALLAALHPTPAVGGWPRKEALARITALEPFDRGWYAGPVGWIGNDEAEFAVAIRSGLMHGNTLSLFTGAGIVRGSNPSSEWTELESKMKAFMNALQYNA